MPVIGSGLPACENRLSDVEGSATVGSAIRVLIPQALVLDTFGQNQDPWSVTRRFGMSRPAGKGLDAAIDHSVRVSPHHVSGRMNIPLSDEPDSPHDGCR